MQRDLTMTELFEEVAGSDSVPKQVVVGMAFLEVVIPPGTPLLQGDIRSQGSGTPSTPHNLKRECQHHQLIEMMFDVPLTKWGNP